MTATPSRRASSRAPEPITSRDNRWLKQFRAALAGDASDGLAAIEGARFVETALRSPAEISALLVSESGARHLEHLRQWLPASAPVLHTTDRLFAYAAATESPQGIAALVRPRQATLDDLLRGTPLVLLLAAVQDPGNVGALIRSAETLGASGAAVCPAGGIGTANPFAAKALRASAGAALRLPILRGVGVSVLLAQLRVAGVRVYAACPEAAGARDPWDVDWRSPAALLVGNEGAGLPADLVASADAAVRIPQSPAEDGMDSLNAAVAGSILLYEAARQRGRAATNP